MVDSSMMDLFKDEANKQVAVLNDCLVLVDGQPPAEDKLDKARKAAHAIKGASKLVKIETIERIAQLLEDCLSKACQGELVLVDDDVAVLFESIEFVVKISESEGMVDDWEKDDQAQYDWVVNSLLSIHDGTDRPEKQDSNPKKSTAKAKTKKAKSKKAKAKSKAKKDDTDSIDTEKKIVESSPSVDDSPAVNPVEVKQTPTSMQDMSMLELFRVEAEQQSKVLNEGLLDLEQDPTSPERLEPLMRAAHSIKGAARLVDVQFVVQLAHIMEDDFVAAQNGEVTIGANDIDVLLRGVDTIQEIATYEGNINQWLTDNQSGYDALLNDLQKMLSGETSTSLSAGASSQSEVDVEPQQQDSHDAAPREVKGVADIPDIQDMSMLELFRVEAEQQSKVLNEGLLELEQDPTSPERLEPLMRAAHSIKGAARLVDIQFVVELAHVMEDDFVAAQNGKITLTADGIDVLLKGVDTIQEVAAYDGNVNQWVVDNKQQYDVLVKNLNLILEGKSPDLSSVPTTEGEKKAAPAPVAKKEEQSEQTPPTGKAELKKAAVAPKERMLRVSAEQVNRLMGLAGESLVESRWVFPYAESLQRLKRQQIDLVCMIDSLREHLDSVAIDGTVNDLARNAQKQASFCREMLSDRLAELESYDRRATNLSSRLHREVVQSRMRPFGDGIHGFPRMVRDISRSLGKDVQLVIEGSSTLVDRDILDKIEAPLNHLIRNAIDHGIESAEERAATSKPAKGSIYLGAYHHAGMLSIVVQDDGHGVDLERLRKKVIDKGLVDQDMADTLGEAELMDFLFLPSFSTKEQVSEISGRGVGLDVVHDVVQEMRGSVRATSVLGEGTKFIMQLPLTLSVIPALLVEISGEPYAFPLARIDRILRVESGQVKEAEGNQFINIDGKNVGLVNASQILEKESFQEVDEQVPLVILAERSSYYGLVVDKFLGERELVVQVLPPALGKVQDIGSAALMEDGSPVLIVDVDDMIRSIEKVLKLARLGKVGSIIGEEEAKKRILVVDDSITVREVERKLLETAGYHVDTAVDGMDGLNMLRSGEYDLLISDVDMPRMNGIELVKTVRQDPNLRSIPVMMVSYKDREEDKIRGMEAGADYYLTKGSLHDESLRQAVVDLIGGAEE